MEQEVKYCGRCGQGKPRSEWTPSTWAKPGQWCKQCYREWHRQRYTPKNDADDAPRTCAVCGVSYRPKNRRPSVYCSRKCKDDARNARRSASDLAAKPAARICMHCGDVLPQRVRADAIFCSKECNYRAHALQRKFRMRTGEEGKPGYMRAWICERDRWRCGICGKPVDRRLAHPDPMCASLDHVKPVADGGTNDLWNLRLTHLVCNLKRGAARGESQTLF